MFADVIPDESGGFLRDWWDAFHRLADLWWRLSTGGADWFSLEELTTGFPVVGLGTMNWRDLLLIDMAKGVDTWHKCRDMTLCGEMGFTYQF